MECGGYDCDDTDPNRYPGNHEICDDGHDEDCDPTTLGDLDDDGDGFVSNACCNGDNCGLDCDDSRRDVFPGATEICNAIDDDCNGIVDDEGDLPLCPGGTCGAGRCVLRAWDRVWGAASDPEPGDDAQDVAMDEFGNLYITGTIYGASDFGAGPLTVSDAPTMYIASYTGDGGLRWARTYGNTGSSVWGRSISYDESSSALFITGYFRGTVTFNDEALSDSPLGSVIISLDTHGRDRWATQLPRILGAPRAPHIDSRNGTVVIVGYMAFPWDFGGGEVIPDQEAFYAAAYDSSGTYQWATQFPAWYNTTIYVDAGVSISQDGWSFFGGTYINGHIELGTELLTGSQRTGFVVALDPTGAYQWHRRAELTGESDAKAVAAHDGVVYVTGQATASADLGAGTGPSDSRSFLLALGSDGAYRWDRRFTGSSRIVPDALAIDAAGNIIVAGSAEGRADIGSGPRLLPTGSSRMSFVTSFRPDSTHRWDSVFGNSGATRIWGLAVGRADSTAICGQFSESADFGSGDRMSVGTSSAFVARLRN